MNIAGLLETLSTSLKFLITDFERIVILVSSNLPVIEREIEEILHIISKKATESEEKIFYRVYSELETIKAPIFDLIIERQKQDIIQQQMEHLLEAVVDV